MGRPHMFLFALVAAVVAEVAMAADTVHIEEVYKPENCDAKAENGLFVGVHYVGTLEDGTEFDNSYKRDEEIEFQLGAGQVIAGWEEGVLGMCLYEKRRLTIPPHLAYGDEGIGPIPGGATLFFDVELVRVSSAPQQPQDAEESGYDVYHQFGDEAYGAEEDGEEVLNLNFGEEDQPEWS